MIGVVETRKVVEIELERSEVINILNGAEMRGHLQIRHEKSDVPMDCKIYCSNPEVGEEEKSEDE